MATRKQIAANRQNARKSTGPRTPAGKTISALNARKHGFAGSTFTVVRLEDLKEIDNLRQDALDFYRPINSQEIFAVERIALCQMALLRIARLESGLMTNCLDTALYPDDEPIHLMTPEMVGDGDIEITRAQNRNFALSYGFRKNTEKPHTWELFLRYQTQAERQYRRAVEDLERLLAMRPEREEPDDSEETPIEPNSSQPESSQQPSVAPAVSAAGVCPESDVAPAVSAAGVCPESDVAPAVSAAGVRPESDVAPAVSAAGVRPESDVAPAVSAAGVCPECDVAPAVPAAGVGPESDVAPAVPAAGVCPRET